MIFDNTISINTNPSKVNPKLYEHELNAIAIEHSPNSILLFKLIVDSTINPPIQVPILTLTLPKNSILHIITSTLMPNTKATFRINNKQIIVFVMIGGDDLDARNIGMETNSIYIGQLA
jgi:hypothetical protein